MREIVCGCSCKMQITPQSFVQSTVKGGPYALLTFFLLSQKENQDRARPVGRRQRRKACEVQVKGAEKSSKLFCTDVPMLPSSKIWGTFPVRLCSAFSARVEKGDDWIRLQCGVIRRDGVGLGPEGEMLRPQVMFIPAQPERWKLKIKWRLSLGWAGQEMYPTWEQQGVGR